MEKVDQFEKCDECEELVNTYVEFYSRRGDVVKVCFGCIRKTTTWCIKKVLTDAEKDRMENGEALDNARESAE